MQNEFLHLAKKYDTTTAKIIPLLVPYINSFIFIQQRWPIYIERVLLIFLYHYFNTCKEMRVSPETLIGIYFKYYVKSLVFFHGLKKKNVESWSMYLVSTCSKVCRLYICADFWVTGWPYSDLRGVKGVWTFYLCKVDKKACFFLA